MLDKNERNLKRLIQEVLVKNRVLKSRTEREWNVYTTRRVLHEFVALFQQRKQEAAAAAVKPGKPKPSPTKKAPAKKKR